MLPNEAPNFRRYLSFMCLSISHFLTEQKKKKMTRREESDRKRTQGQLRPSVTMYAVLSA